LHVRSSGSALSEARFVSALLLLKAAILSTRVMVDVSAGRSRSTTTRRRREGGMRSPRLVALLAISAFLLGSLSQPARADHGNAAEVFERTWQRTDLPVVSDVVQRTWMWGPESATEILHEPYAESEGGQRSVQYYDKARMEVTFADGEQTSVWYVTNGLLVVELVTGRLQLGDNTFDQRGVAQVNVAGDAADAGGPTYATMAEVLDEPAANVGNVLTQRISRAGILTTDPGLASQAVTAESFVSETGHSIAAPFWEFMNSQGTVFEGGAFTTASLFLNPFFATGFPITEAYWADVLVGGEPTLVLIQCFERRCLTYTPVNAPEWQVEAGNVGLHYRAWREEGGTAPPSTPPDCEPGEGPDYAGQQLAQPAFIGQDLTCADFSGANVSQGNFSEADAAFAVFDGATLTQPIFRNTDLTGASLLETDLDQAVFEGSLAMNADFSDALIDQPLFFGANLLGAEMRSATFILPGFVNTICPDSTNSDDNGGTCLGNLEPLPPPSQ
jgi:hypothetical protein